MNKAVVLGCNYYIGLSIIRCLGKENIHVVACDYDFGVSSYGSKSKYVSEYLHIDNLNQANAEVKDKLIEYAKRQEKKPVLYPTHDKYVEFIDSYYEELSEYYLISQAPNKLTTELLDKWKLRDVAIREGVRIPETYNILDADLYAKIEKIGFPCIIKPSENTKFINIFRTKVFVCNNLEELKRDIDKCKENYIDAFVQEIVPGFDDHMYTYDCYIDQKGNTTHFMTAQKQRQWPINFGASVFTEQRYTKELVDIGRPFLENIGYRGFAEIEFKKHAVTGEYYLIEINARTTNFNNLIYKVGLNMPYIMYKDLTVGLSEVDKKHLTNDTNYAFIYFKEDIRALIKYSQTNQLSFISGFAKIFTKKLAPAIWSIDDIRPWVSFNTMLFNKMLNKVLKK